MSLKPLKKSDLEKNWMKKRRDKVIRIQPEYHLIVTEGTETEPQYFQSIRDIINRTAELCTQNSTSDTQYHAIWSNQCIELWFLLHFSFLQSDLHRSEYWPKLTEWLTNIEAGSYTKGRSDMYQVLEPYMEIGIANAKRLDQINQGKAPASAAPGTKVYELLEMLKPYLLNQ